MPLSYLCTLMKYKKGKHLSYINILYPAFALCYVFVLILILICRGLSI